MFERREVPANRRRKLILVLMLMVEIFNFLACIAVRRPTGHAAWIGATAFVGGLSNRDPLGFGMLERAQ